jgi:hypothetical protein
MLAALIIVFREVIEAGLVIGIVLATARGVHGRVAWVGVGVLAGVAGACLVAAFAGAIGEAFAGSGQELFNAAVLSVAVLIVFIVIGLTRCRFPDALGPSESDQAGFQSDETQVLPVVSREIDTQAGRRSFHDGQRLRVCLRPVGPELTEENIGRDRSHAVEVCEPLLQIARIGSPQVQAIKAAPIVVDELAAVAEDLPRFALVVADVTTVPHHWMDEEIPSRIGNCLRGE